MQKIRNVWCAVRNYRDTAKEVHAKVPSEPTFFLKAGSTVTTESDPIHLTSFSNEIVHEIEVALQFDENMQVRWAGLALDLTARDLQKQAVAQSFPWTLSKSFRGSCPIGNLFPVPNISSLENLDFWLEINGEIRQRGNTKDMVFSMKEQIAFLLIHFPICPYDLVLTGTPGGVAQIKKGDRLVGKISDRYTARWAVSE